MKAQKILVVGATGAQGTAVINALVSSSPSHPHRQILALTRSATASKALALARKHPSIAIIEGELSNPEAIFASHDDIDSVFLITAPSNDEAHGIALIDAAVASRVRHVVFSSVDRGGDDRSWDNPTTVGHYAEKHRVELHLRAATADTSTQWTILRPTGFMDNYRPSSFASMMAGLWATIPADRKMQLVSVEDIGKVVGTVLMDPGRWTGKAIGLAGDELSFAEADAAYKGVFGHAMPRNWSVISQGIRWAVSDARQSMEWFEKEGFKVDIDALRRDGFEMQSFEAWLRSIHE